MFKSTKYINNTGKVQTDMTPAGTTENESGIADFWKKIGAPIVA
jgi:hypothetical protein